jgi:hypothetical protein
MASKLRAWVNEKMPLDYENVSEDALRGDELRLTIGEVNCTVWRTVPMADPTGYLSLFIWPMNVLRDQFGLSKWRMCELLYLAMRVNSAFTFYHMVKNWMRDGSNALVPTEDGGEVDGPNFLRRYSDECRTMGLSSALQCKMPRFQVSERRFVGEDARDDGRIRDNIGRLCEIVRLANDDATMDQANVVQKLHREVEFLGPTKVLSFYGISVHVGLLYSPHAVVNSMKQVVSRSSAFTKYVEEELSLDVRKANMVVRAVACRWDKPVFVVENVSCKMARATYRCGSVKRRIRVSSELSEGSELPEAEDVRMGQYPSESEERRILKRHGDVFVGRQMVYLRKFDNDNRAAGNVHMGGVRLYMKCLTDKMWRPQEVAAVL